MTSPVRPRLDLDVLLEIFRFSDMATQSQIMKTCRILSREGGQLLVRRNKVSLSTDVEMESFLRFMRADGHARIPHLRTLALHSSVVHTSSQTTEMRITLLSDLVRWNTGLKRLTCECTNDNSTLDLRLARSIAQLTTLTHLSIYYVDHPTWAILHSMRSRLTGAHIQFYNADHDFRAPPSHELDLMRFLQGSRKTLRSLWLEVSNLTAIVTSTGPVYPCMRELDIKSATPWVSIASHLIRAFPRLEVLDIEDEETWVNRPDVDSPQCVASRAANRSYQQAHGSWKKLTYFRGEARHLYALAPTCRIEHLFIDEIGLSVDAMVLRAMLADARPTILELGLNVNEHFLQEDWLSALCEPRTPQVQVITVKMGLRGEQEEMDMERAIEAMYDIVARVSPTAFHLDIERYSYRSNGPRDTYGDGVDLQAVADRLMNSSPSMKTALVSLDYPPTRMKVKARAGSRIECARLFEDVRWILDPESGG